MLLKRIGLGSVGILFFILPLCASARAGENVPTKALEQNSLSVTIFSPWTETGDAVIFPNVSKNSASHLCAIASHDSTCKWNGKVVRPIPYSIGSLAVSLNPVNDPLQSGMQYIIEVFGVQQGARYKIFAVHKDLLNRVTGIHELETREEVPAKYGVRVFSWYVQQRVTRTDGTVSIEPLPQGTYELQVANITNGTLSLPSARFRIGIPSRPRSASVAYAANTPLINGYWDGRGLYFDGGSGKDTLKLVGTMAMYDIFRGTDFPEKNQKNTVVFVQGGSAVIVAYNVEKIAFGSKKLTIHKLLDTLAGKEGAIYRTKRFNR